MPRLVFVLLMIGVLGVVAAATLSAAPPTTEQLKAAILKPEDAGPDFTTEFDGVSGDTGPLYLAQYIRLAPREVVSVMLADAGQSTLEEVSRSFLQGVASVPSDTTAQPVPTPAVGRESVSGRFTARVQGVDVMGELVAWQQGEVLALVSTIGGTSERLLSLVDRQQARLYITFTPTITCAIFAWQEEAQAVLALDPADPHKLDPAASGVACAELAKRPPPGAGIVTGTGSAVTITPTPTATPAPPLDPVRALVGKTTDVCTGQNRLRTTIEQADIHGVVGDRLRSGWIVLIVRVINLGPAIRNVPLFLQNEEGRGYNVLPQRQESVAAPGIMYPREPLSFDYSLISLPPDTVRPPVNMEAGQSLRVAAAFGPIGDFRPVGLWAGRQCPP
jgi:hypothetical protein